MEEDFELVEKFINMSISIEKLYKKLYELEINDKKDGSLYKKLVDYLNSSIETEKRLYDREITDCSRCTTIVGIIMKDELNDKGVLDDTDSIANHDYSDRIYKRVLNNLFDRLILNKESLQSLADKLYYLGIDDKDELKEMYNKASIHSALESDTLRGYLSFLKDYIFDYKMYNADLTKSKYNVAFINSSIEDEMIRNDFNISDNYFVTSKIVSQINDVGDDEYDKIKNSYALSTIIEQANRLLEISDKDYYDGDEEKIFDSILIRCIIDSSMQLVDEEFLASLYYDFNEFTTNNNSNSHCSEGLIVKCFIDYKGNRFRKSIVSFKK